jgi:hypothetical protein
MFIIIIQSTQIWYAFACTTCTYIHTYVYVLHIWVRVLKRVHSSLVPIAGPEETSFMLTETSSCRGRNNISSYLVQYPNYITPGCTVLLK